MKKKIGRPRVTKNSVAKQTMLTLPKKLIKRINEHQERYGTPFAHLVRVALIEYFERIDGKRLK